MSITRSYETDSGIETKLNILYTPDGPLFLAEQIGYVMEIENITDIIEYFTMFYEKQIVDSIWFLTDLGVYRILSDSAEEHAFDFKIKFNRMVREIDKHGDDELRIEKQEKHDSMIPNSPYYMEPVIYLAEVDTFDDGHILLKLGKTKNIKQTFKYMCKEFKHVYMRQEYFCKMHVEFMKWIKDQPLMTKYKYDGPIKNVLVVTQAEYITIVNFMTVHYERFN